MDIVPQADYSQDKMKLSPFPMAEEAQLLKPRLFRTFTWNVTQGNIILRVKFPNAFLDSDNPHKLILERYTGLRCKLKFNVEFTNSPLLGGAFIMAWLPPYNILGDVQVENLNLVLASPHVIVDVNKGDGAELNVPIVYPTDFIHLEDDTSMGELLIYQFLPLVTPPDTLPITPLVNITYTISEPEMLIPFYPASEAEIKSQGLINKVVGSTINSLPQKFEKVLNRVADNPVFKLATSLYGFSTPTNVAAPIIAQPSVHDSYINSRSIFNGHVLALTKDTVVPNNIKEIYEGEDTMIISNMMAKEVYRTRWSCNSATPALQAEHVAVGVSQDDGHDANIQRVVTRLVQYWRGTIIFRLHYAMNTLTKCKLVYTYTPKTLSGNLTNSFRTNYMNETIELTGTGYIDIPIPFTSNFRVKNTLDRVGTISFALLAPILSGAGSINTSDVNFLLTQRFTDDLELYGNKSTMELAALNGKSIYPNSLVSLQKIEHIKDLLLLPVDAALGQGTHTDKLLFFKPVRFGLSNLYAIKKEGYRFYITSNNKNEILYISYSYNGNKQIYSSFIPFVPNISPTMAIEIPRINNRNFDLCPLHTRAGMINEMSKPELVMVRPKSNMQLYITRSVSDDSIYAWYLPNDILARVLEYPTPQEMVVTSQ